MDLPTEADWTRAIREAKELQELTRYEALVAEVPELRELEEAVERAVHADDRTGLVELARRHDKALEAYPRIWAARERWRAAMRVARELEARARGGGR